MSWAGFLVALLGCIADIAVFLKQRGLIKAAEAEVIAAGCRETTRRVALAAEAAKEVKDDPASIAADPNNRDRDPVP